MTHLTGRAMMHPMKHIYDKFINGDRLTIEELKAGHAHYEKLSKLLLISGPVFVAACMQAGIIADMLRIYLDNHKFDAVCEDRNSDSYREGYRTGIVWNQVKDNYRPGGPHEYYVRPNESNKPEWVALCEETQRHARCWLMGFDEGLAAQKAGHKATPDMLCCGQQEGAEHRHWLPCLVDRPRKVS